MATKTAMQEYSERLMNILGDDIVNNFTIEQTNAGHYLYKEMLEKEKQQIIDAVKTGLENPLMLNGSDIAAEQYYTQTYTP